MPLIPKKDYDFFLEDLRNNFKSWGINYRDVLRKDDKRYILTIVSKSFLGISYDFTASVELINDHSILIGKVTLYSLTRKQGMALYDLYASLEKKDREEYALKCKNSFTEILENDIKQKS